MRRLALLFGLLLAAPWPALAQSAPAQSAPAAAPRTPLLIEGKRTLFQRVIARPGAILQPRPGPLPAGAAARPVPGFSVFYVYARHSAPEGATAGASGGASGGGGEDWVEVGRAADGRTEGWMPAAKAIPWQHTMVAAFANPAGRGRVLFLGAERDARALVLDADPAARVRTLRAGIQAGAPGPVVALEPDRFVDITRNFYLLPILSAERVERENGPALRLLEVVSAPAEQGAPPPSNPQALRDYRAGVVFLMDTTVSMQPYIDRTRAAIRAIVDRIGQTAVRDNFRFGLVAYRDSLDDSPGLEYATRVYAKPDFSRPPDAINAAIEQVAQARASSSSFAEDAVGGLKAALDEIDWTGMAGRFVVLVTDASARPSTHRFSLTGLNIPEIREVARAKGVVPAAIHLKTADGRTRRDHETARAQYEALTRFGGAGSLYYPVENGDPAAFAATVEQLSTALLQQVAEATGRPVAGLRPGGDARMREQMQVVAQAVRLAYLGRVEGTRAPDVVRGWTADRDLEDPVVSSLEVRVLLTRNQLSDLAQALKSVLEAGLAGRTDPRGFFNNLRAAFAAATRDPSRLARSDRIGALLGEYLDGLPYQSEIMDIREEDWLAMGAIAQRQVLNNVESKLRLYQEFQAHPDLWVDLSGTRGPGEALFPVPIEALP